MTLFLVHAVTAREQAAAETDKNVHKQLVGRLVVLDFQMIPITTLTTDKHTAHIFYNYSTNHSKKYQKQYQSEKKPLFLIRLHAKDGNEYKILINNQMPTIN